jgi:hypothetical protein
MAGTRGLPKGEGAFPFPRSFLLVAFFALNLSACGIQGSVTTFSPPSFVFNSPNTLSLGHNLDNNDTTATSGVISGFKGYEIYYRAYYLQSDADAARALVETAASDQTKTPEYCNSLLTQNGFSRVFDAAGNDGPDGIRPLFSIPSYGLTAGDADPYVIYLDASSSSTGNWYFTRSTAPGASQSVITRSTSTPNPNSQVSFESYYSASTTSTGDYFGQSDANASQLMYFVFFAEAYGVDTNSGSFTNIYSKPACLYQSVPYTLPNN